MASASSTGSNQISRRTALLASAGVGFSFAAGVIPRPARAATEKISFQLDWIPYGRHAPYYAALENGYYAEKGLEVTIVQGRNTTQTIQALISGQSQFIFQDIPVMLAARAQGTNVKALACMYQKTPHTLFYIKGPGMAAPKDIETKTIAFTPGDAPRRMFSALSKANNIDENKLKWLAAEPNAKNAVLLNHQADGMLTYIFTLPVLQKAAQGEDQVGAFVFSDFGADFYSNGLGALDSFIKEKPQVTHDFVRATMKGVQFTLDNPAAAIGMLKKHQLQLDEVVALKEIEILRDLTMAGKTKVLGAVTTEKMQETQELMIKYLDLKTPVPIQDAFTNEFLV